MEMKLRATLFLITRFYGFTISMDYTRTHFYVEQTMNWNEAQRYCRLNYDDLSTIGSTVENDEMPYITSHSLSSSNKNGEHYSIWIGLYTHSSNLPNWKWSGDNTLFTMWQTREPSNVTEACAYYDTRNSKWYPDSCSQNFTFFCMEDTPRLILVQRHKTWEEALDYCRNNYTDLASLQSDEDNIRAVKKSEAAETKHMWIGLNFVFKYWIWVNGNALEYQAWSEEGHPNCPDRKYSCGALTTENNTWIPKDCDDKLYFLCLK